MRYVQKHMSFTVDLQDAIITAELNRIISDQQVTPIEPAAEVRYEFCNVL